MEPSLSTESIEQLIIRLSTSVGVWIPFAYVGALAALAWWLTARTQLPGRTWLAGGWSLSFAALVAAKVIVEAGTAEYVPESDTEWTLPDWYFTASSIVTLMHAAAGILVAIGFWKLCQHLVSVMPRNEAGDDSGATGSSAR